MEANTHNAPKPVTIEKGTELTPQVQRAENIANQYNFNCRIYSHADHMSGKSSEDAVAALGKPIDEVLKCLYIKKSGEPLGYGAILTGNSKLDLKLFATLVNSSKSKLRFAKPDEAEADTGYQYGGIPVTAFKEKGIATFVDQSVLTHPLVTASGGSEYHAMEFNPAQLPDKLGYTVTKIS